MIKIIEKRICDVCKKEVENFYGSLSLKYSDHDDYTGCGYPVEIECEDVCIDCCRKLDKFVSTALEEMDGET
jgi:hypothetical protein